MNDFLGKAAARKRKERCDNEVGAPENRIPWLIHILTPRLKEPRTPVLGSIVTARAELTTKLKNSPSKSSLRVLDLPWGMICHDIYLAVERIAKIIRDFGYIKVKQQVAEFAEVAALAGNAHTELAAVFIFII